MGDFRGLTETVTVVQPTSALKAYRCPGCQGVIPKGTFHLLVIPDDQPELRRHWHQGCWQNETRLRPSSGVPD